MTGKTERVILIKGDATKWYDQAIFIVNQNTPPERMPVNFVAEAEKIITNYLEREKKSPLAIGKGQVSSAPVPAPAHMHHHTSAARTQPKAAKPGKKSGKADFVINMLMILACIAIVAVFVYGMMI